MSIGRESKFFKTQKWKFDFRGDFHELIMGIVFVQRAESWWQLRVYIEVMSIWWERISGVEEKLEEVKIWRKMQLKA